MNRLLFVALILLPATTYGATPREQAEAEVADLFKSEVVAARTPAQKADLAQKLHDLAKDEKDANNKFALLEKSAKIAALVGKSDLVLEDLTLASSTQLNVEVLSDLSYGRSIEDISGVLDFLDNAIGKALDEEDYPNCKRLADLEVYISRKDVELGKRAKSKYTEVILSIHEAQQVARFKKTLESTPLDPDANLAVGKYLCFYRGNWDKGVPMLAIGSDAGLSAVAVADLEVKKVEEMIAVGDKWKALKGKDRAIYWYKKALDTGSVAGLQKIRLEREVAGGKSEKWIDLLASVDPAKDAISGKWEKKGKTLTSNSENDTPIIALPIVNDNDYKLTIDFNRQKGTDAICIFLPLDNKHSCMLMLSGWDGKIGGLEEIDGVGASNNATTFTPCILQNNVPHGLEIDVKHLASNGVLVMITLDKKSVIKWQGNIGSVGLSKTWNKMPLQKIGLGNYKSNVSFLKCLGSFSTKRQ